MSLRCNFSIRLLFSVLLLAFLGKASAWGQWGDKQRVLLSQVDTLILYGDRTTEYRRTVSPKLRSF